MIRPLLSLNWLSFDEKGSKVRYQHGKEKAEEERMEF